MKQTLLEKTVAGYITRVEVAPRDGRIVVSIGHHRVRDGKGSWVNLDVREAADVIDALERAHQIAQGD